MYCATSIDEYGEILQVISSQDKGVVDFGAHPNSAEIIPSAPPSRTARWIASEGVWRERPDPPSAKHIWDRKGGAWADPRTLEDLRSSAWERIKAARMAAETAPVTACGGRLFQADILSQMRIQAAVQLAQLAYTGGTAAQLGIPWTLADNSVYSLSYADVIDLGLSVAQQVMAAHAKGRVLRTIIESATTRQEIDAVQWA